MAFSKKLVLLLLAHMIISVFLVIILILYGFEAILFKNSFSFIVVVLPIVYMITGYNIVKNIYEKKYKFLILLSVSILGFLFWCWSAFNYLTDDLDARMDRAVAPIVVPSEVVWLLYGLYNNFVYAIFTILEQMKSFTYNKYIISIIFLMVNFLPFIFMYIGSLLRDWKVKRDLLKTWRG
ncbi:hypothetical protein [Paenibacillus sp. NPDC058174]|uniref:hypothetical protein n=1 Tax=Paenibacillus sp. NPDC058174 TaxID=3346366 RepID=UPI0036DE5783